MNNLATRLLKKSKLDGSSILSKSTFMNSKEYTSTPIPVINLAFSGKLDGGFSSGLHMLAGKSKSFKSLLGLIMCKAYLDKNPEGLILFYDSEFGITQSYLESNGIDAERVIHIPIMNIEEWKFDVMNKLEELTRDDKVMIFVDSVGNLASKKEVEDALNEKSVADMTRAKQMKSVYRMITPYLTKINIPMVVINHTYAGMDQYSPDVVSGGTGGIYSSDNIMVIGKRKIKDGKDLTGHTFILNAEKSRFIKEKSAIPFEVTFDGGIDTYSGLLDIAKITGHVECPKMGWYTRTSVENDKNWRRKESSCKEFWQPLLEDENFLKAVKSLYSLDSGPLFREDLSEILNEDIDIDKETGEILSFDQD